MTNTYHADVDGRSYGVGRAALRPEWGGTGLFANPVAVPIDGVTERVSAGDTTWQEYVDLDGEVGAFIRDALPKQYDGGEQVSSTWAKKPFRPSVPQHRAGLIRGQNTLDLWLFPFADSANHGGFDIDSYDVVQMRLTADGGLVGESPDTTAIFDVDPAPADYELSLEVTRDADWWLHSTRTQSLWSFRSEAEPEGTGLPLLQVDYGVDLDLLNTTDGPVPIRFDAYPAGGEDESMITEFGVSWSVDDGASWTDLDLNDLGTGSFEGTVDVPASCEAGCFVSLRITAADDTGNGLEQEITRAFTARAGDEPEPTFGWDLKETESAGSFADWTRSATRSRGLRVTVARSSELLTPGMTFTDVAPPEGVGDGLLFRDLEVGGKDQQALVLAIGAGEASRVYRTTDQGANWTETFRSDDPDSFYDCMAMIDRRHGILMGDAVAGKFQIQLTEDGGRTWTPAPASGMPDALPGEAGFAASGTCLNTTHRGAWFGTGGGAQARVFYTSDNGLTWDVSTTPIRSTEAGGIFSIDFRTNRLGIAIGGDFTTPEEATDAIARSTDGGITWELVDEADAPSGYRSGLAWWGDRRGDTRTTITDERRTIFAVGPTGSDVSQDRGKTWQPFDPDPFHSVECVKRTTTCWASGPDGRIATLTLN